MIGQLGEASMGVSSSFHEMPKEHSAPVNDHVNKIHDELIGLLAFLKHSAGNIPNRFSPKIDVS